MRIRTSLMADGAEMSYGSWFDTPCDTVAHMFSLRRSLSMLFVGLVLATPAGAADMTPGDLLIYRVGDGSASLVKTGNPVFLDEYSQSGTLVASFAVPTTPSGANHSLFASGTATSEGMLTLSADGRYVSFTGYESLSAGAGSLASSLAADNNRVVGLIDAHGNIDTTTALSDFADGNNPRSAVTSDGTDIWVSGAAGGVRYTTLGASTSVQLSSSISNSAQVNIFDGQLYMTSNKNPARGLNALGSGLPTTSGQSYASLVTSTTTDTFDSFFLANLNNSPGPDTLYLCDESQGILKYSLIGNTWTAEGSQGIVGDIYRGLVGLVEDGGVQLFSTRDGGSGAFGGGELVSITDTSGFGGTMDGSFTVLADADLGTAFRGVSFVPVATVPEPSFALRFAASVMSICLFPIKRRRSPRPARPHCRSC
ncbi:MAG: hypothetical protein ABSH20_04270 [Tepidisphaeraceae bacterium]|jgi:hypothetical protein